MGLISNKRRWKWKVHDFIFAFTTSLFFSSGVVVDGGGTTGRMELEGPSLLHIPNPVTYFSNSVGTTLSCLGKGHPPLAVSWLSLQGELLPQIPGLRESLPNGSLSFGSFRFEEYSVDIHNSQFQCAVSNPMGTYLSPILNIRAVLDTPFELFITAGMEEGEIVEGNPVVLHCNISPSAYSNFVHVIAWKSVDQFGYQTQIPSDGTRYQMTSRGSLIIFQAKYQQQLYVCVAQNTLNKKTQSSSPFLVKSLQATSGAVTVALPPKTSARWEQAFQVDLGKSLELTCPAIASSPLHFRWEKIIPNSKGRLPVPTGLGIDVYGPVLSFNRIEARHNGTYRCEVSNTFGSIILDFHVLLTRPTVLVIEPKRKFMHRIGSSLEFTCKLSSTSSQFTNILENENYNALDLTWYKNGKLIPVGQAYRIKIVGNKLHLVNTQLDDQGVYQCFGLFEGQSFQTSTEIVFEATPPELQQTFISQSLQPGPTVSLKCSATGNPFPELKWFVDGQELVSWPTDDPVESRYWQISDRYSVGSYRQYTEIVSHVNITNVRVEDSGAFQCSASNLLGIAVHSARLNVYGPLFVKDMPSLTLVADETALIPCMYGGYPVDKIIWQKNSKDVIEGPSQNSRFTILSNGTLKIDKINTEIDRGQYTCVISNRKGETALGSVDVNVMHPPVISVFSFDDNLIEGQRTSATCNVVSGDLPIDIKWLKDYQLIPSVLNITEMRVKFLSYLIFEELAREHSGTYICSASNGAATRNHSAVLSVKVSPYWIQEPQDVKVILRASHIIPCVADGVPKPGIKWFRDTGVMKLPVQNDRRFEILEDGSLKLEEVEAVDSSNYVCEASNGVGSGLGKSIRLHVNIPAKVSAPLTTVVIAEGLPTLLKCHIRGDLPVQVEWRKNSIVIREQTPRVFQETVLQGNSTILQALLHLDRTEKSDSGVYTCIASNHYGRDEDRISVEVKARPPAPEDFTVDEIGSRFIRLKWSPGVQTASTAPVTYFVLQFKKSGTPSWVNEGNNVTVQYPAVHSVLEPLNPVTNYDIRILASNEIGHSVPAEPLVVLTLPEAPSGPPLNISATPVSSTSVLVRWDSPNPSLQHGAILGYQVFATLQPNNHAGTNNTTTIVDEKWRQHTEIHSLKSNSRYRISIRAYNSAGMGPDSPFVYVHTPEGVPDAPPQNVQCEGLSSRSLHIQWDPPPAHLSNGIIQGYKVIYQPIQDEKYGEKPEVKKTSNRETTLHGLQSFTNYSLRTLAFTLGGEGVLSVPLFCLTEEDIPDEPSDLKVLSTSSTSALVSWLPPLHPNGIMRKYTIYWKADDVESIKEKIYTPPTGSHDEEELNLEIRRLRENTKYTFWVTGTTSAGTGKSSKVQSVLLSSKVGSKIASFPVIRNTVIDQAVLLNCKAIGVPPPEISWLRKNRVETSHRLLRNGSLFISRVKDQDEGLWTCRADNGIGIDEVVHQIILNRPPPVVPLFLGYVSSSSVQIHWEPPQKPDPPVTGYVLHYRRESSSSSSVKLDDDWNEKRLNSRTTSHTLENINCGTVYLFKLAAENVIGLGSFSTELKTKTNGQKPDVDPKLNEILDGNGTAVQIDLTRWPNGGCPLKSNFQIEYKPKESINWQRIYRLDNYTQKFTFDAVPGTTYELRIAVENDAGGATKLFEIDSSSDFFVNYEKMMKEKGRLAEERSSGDYFLRDAHVVIVVPIVSAVICTSAIALCVLIIRRRRDMSREEWKFAQSASQHTWLSSEDGHSGKLDGISGRGGNPSVYATLNSAKPIPMEIRDSTVRFQTFGQRDNFEAVPPIPTPNYKKYRRKSGPSLSPPDGMNLEVSCISSQNDYGAPIEPRNYRYYEENSDSDEDDESLYPDYARPYQPGYRPAGGGKSTKRDTGKHTAGRKKQMAARSRGSSREFLE